MPTQKNTLGRKKQRLNSYRFPVCPFFSPRRGGDVREKSAISKDKLVMRWPSSNIAALHWFYWWFRMVPARTLAWLRGGILDYLAPGVGLFRLKTFVYGLVYGCLLSFVGCLYMGVLFALSGFLRVVLLCFYESEMSKDIYIICFIL